MTTSDGIPNPTRMPGGYNLMSRKLFERLSKGDKTPKWQMAALHCWANMDRRGHCPMPAGELSRFLGQKSHAETRRIVQEAVDRGWLAHGSNDRCMIAPFGVEFKAGNYRSRKICEHH